MRKLMWFLLAAALVFTACCAQASEDYLDTAAGGQPPDDIASPPLIDSPPVFAKMYEERVIQAVVMGKPDKVVLEVNSEKGVDIADMQICPSGLYAGTIPGRSVTGKSLKYCVAALYGQQWLKSKTLSLVVRKILNYGANETVFTRRVLVKRPWGKGAECFGMFGGDERVGARIIPQAIAADNATAYLLDTPNARILAFSLEDGKLLKEIPLPTVSATDLIIDKSNSSLIVVDKATGAVYRVVDGKANLIKKINMSSFDCNARFIYDLETRVLSVRDAAQGTYIPVLQGETELDRSLVQPAVYLSAEVEEQSVMLSLRNDTSIRIHLNTRVVDVPEVVCNEKGVTWFVVGLIYDDKIYRQLVRFDPGKGSAGFAWIETDLPEDITRRMAATDNGVVLFEGDSKEGRIVLYLPGKREEK